MSAIEWTEKTWNPVTGCDRVSPGCAHCYALDLAASLKRRGQGRYQKDGDPKTSGPGFGVTLHPDKLDEPLRRKKPTMWFVNSMSDLFHEEIPDSYIDRVFAVMALAERHTFQVLTKRPERRSDYLNAWQTEDRVVGVAWDLWHESGCDISSTMQIALGRDRLAHHWPSRNVWLGVSIENRRFVHRADLLRETPAAVRFVSAEPLLGPLIGDLTGPGYPAEEHAWMDDYYGPGLDLTGIDWLIVGGESNGPKARRLVEENIVGQLRSKPAARGWVHDLRDAARANGTAFFFKQWGGRTPKAGGRELDGRTWDEFPARESVAA